MLFADYDQSEIARLTFQHALLGYTLPALDAGSKDAAMMTVKFKPETARKGAGQGDQDHHARQRRRSEEVAALELPALRSMA